MKATIAILILIIISGCSKSDLIQYQDNNPQFSLFNYFDGQTTGWGIVQDRQGNLTRQFVVEIKGSVTGNNLSLEEDFDWSDGQQSKRIWTITKTDDHTFTGTADDVVGTATGSAYGNVLNWKYSLNIEVDGSTWEIGLDDWMFLQPNNVLINKTRMSKFGIHLGDITITFRKRTEQEVK